MTDPSPSAPPAPWTRPDLEAALAPYACRPSATRGRLVAEPESASRTVYQRDRDRIIHCTGFRRLKYKTQVFVYHEGDHYRTRLSHSLEVAQIARSIARALALDEDLAEALALAHDLGHPPFGHAGEDALDAEMAAYDGFDHNAQTLRLVTELEHRYAAFTGLNLTWEALEGLAKHNGPVVAEPIDPADPPMWLPFALRCFVPRWDLALHSYAGGEAQVAALSDDIAYNNHDIDDGLRAGLFALDALAEVPLVGETCREVREACGAVPQTVFVHELVRRLIRRMVEDVLTESRARLSAMAARTAADLRGAGRPAIAFSDAMAAQDRELKSFLRARMYNHYLVNRATSKGRRVVRDLFGLYTNEPNVLPGEWAAKCDRAKGPATARAVADFIAGMTDRYAVREHQKLFDTSDMPL
ncbi:deoxyguanosinetriphosphate triphosphohydrolase [Rhodothalassium salexigens]|uniref:deoxyguanosinetriphosphate triphosphohydrolase n=1 Tax=Rhodothalassium salexigens TaxID=1086 RepID=UPI001914CF20|nr:deoxyguanosinetriphosphate triphosphohydrolase [Rhodothalassium salexigens]MBK5911778.1 deoxyguanosinetriphosphate triphosphohydrolase [Rhodothalassium salexigens]